MVKVGKMDKRLNVMNVEKVSDGAGGYEEDRVIVKTTWGKIESIRGKEFWEAAQTQAEVSHAITIRYTKDVNRTHLMEYNGRIFDIQYIIDVDEARRFLEIRVLERL